MQSSVRLDAGDRPLKQSSADGSVRGSQLTQSPVHIVRVIKWNQQNISIIDSATFEQEVIPEVGGKVEKSEKSYTHLGVGCSGIPFDKYFADYSKKPLEIYIDELELSEGNSEVC